MSNQQSHLSEQEIEKLRKRLESERERLHELVRSTLARTQSALQAGSANEEPSDYADQGYAITQEDTELALGENDQVLLAQVERALARISAGTYGLSEVSGKEIPIERLEILPWATTNVNDIMR